MIANIVLPAVLAMAGMAKAQVTATGTMGTTNPPQATMGTPINQTSYSRLLSLNAIDDFCLFAPPVPGDTIGDTEEEQVAWCVQPRNNARVIPDNTFTAVHFVKTPLYWQIQGLGKLTNLNIKDGDTGGELDPHGATGNGNPVGGNVTANATGQDVHYEEWMNYMAYNEFCFRICIAENSTYSAAIQCQHTLDVMGCEFVMPGDYSDNSFTECDGDSAYPPGVYPLPGGGYSTFAQRYTGTNPDGSLWTIGDLSTPSAAASVPATSNCKTYSTIGNGVALSQIGAVSGSNSSSAASASTTPSSSNNSTKSGTTSGSKTGASAAAATAKSSTSSGSSSSASSSPKSAASPTASLALGPVAAIAGSVFALLAGAGALLF